MFKIIWFQNIFLDLNLELLKSHSWISIWDKSFWIDNIAFEKFTWQSCGMWILLNFFLQLKHSQEMSYIVQYVLCSGLPVKAFWLLDSTILSNSLYKINYCLHKNNSILHLYDLLLKVKVNPLQAWIHSIEEIVNQCLFKKGIFTFSFYEVKFWSHIWYKENI